MSRAAQDMVILADVAQALGVPPAALGVSGLSDQPPILDNVDRRDFFGGAAGLAVAVLLPQAVVTPGRIDATHATQCWTALHRLFELDDRHGGATVYQVAEGMARRLQDALRRVAIHPRSDASCRASQRRPWSTRGGSPTTPAGSRRHGTGGWKRAISLI